MLQFTEKIEPVKILQLLSKGLPYYLESWQDIDERCGLFGAIDPTGFNMRSVGLSSPVIEYVLRPHLNILCALSGYIYLNRHGIVGPAIDRDGLADKLRRGLAWACACHVTGDTDVEGFLERKRWGENWRSGLWATMLGVIAVFAGEALDEGEQARIREIVAHEADRFVGVSPPTGGGGGDSRAEENAQDTMLLAWAINICPGHLNLPGWEDALKLWAVNVDSSVHDGADHSEYFGASIAKAVSTCNLYPDFTAEEHGFFHPDALSYGAWNVLAEAAYAFHGREAPAYLSRKTHQLVFDVLIRFCMPNGLFFAPGGQETPLFMPRPLALAWGHWHSDPRAMHITGKLLSWMDGLSDANSDAGVPWVLGFSPTRDGWELLFQSQVGAELALMACLPFPKEHRAFSAGQLEKAIDTKQIYPYTEICYRRNVRSTRSAAWKAIGGHPMIGLHLHSCPELLAPFKAALLGVPSVNRPVKSVETIFHSDRYLRDGFDTGGRVAYLDASGQRILTRDIRAITWGEEGLVLFDQITANAALTVNEQYLSPAYIVNDRWTAGAIELVSGSLRDTILSEQRKYKELPCPALWATINNQLLYQIVWGRGKGGLYYLPGGERNAPPYWKNCRLDMLATHVEPAEASPGDVVYKSGFYIGGGKGPKMFKASGVPGEFFKGLVIMDGKTTACLD